MKIVILDAKTLGEDISFEPLAALGELTVYGSTEPDEVAARIAECDVVILNKLKMGAHNLADAKNLKLVCETATGYDNIDVEYCRSRGIGVANVVGYSTDSVAQLTLALVLELVMHMRSYTGFVESGEYTASGVANKLEPRFYELSGKTWGIVGMGTIGKKVAKIAEAFGCRVICTKRTPEAGFDVVPLEALMKESDIITVHLPLSDSTRGIISRAMLSLMKPTAVIVNVARGAVFDEEALAAAVESGSIAGAAADVYSVEPFGAEHCYSRVMHLDNFILTPHMAWGAFEARERCIKEIAENISAFSKGLERNRVDL